MHFISFYILECIVFLLLKIKPLNFKFLKAEKKNIQKSQVSNHLSHLLLNFLLWKRVRYIYCRKPLTFKTFGRYFICFWSSKWILFPAATIKLHKTFPGKTPGWFFGKLGNPWGGNQYIRMPYGFLKTIRGCKYGTSMGLPDNSFRRKPVVPFWEHFV